MRPVATRQAVRHLLKALDLSERRACALASLARRVVRYVSIRSGRCRPAPAPAGSGGPETPLWLSPPGLLSSGARRLQPQSQEAVSPLPGGRSESPSSGWPQAGTGNAFSHEHPSGTRVALELGFCLRCPDLRSPVPYPGRYRRFQPQEPRIGRRHVIVRGTCGAGTDDPEHCEWQLFIPPFPIADFLPPHDCHS